MLYVILKTMLSDTTTETGNILAPYVVLVQYVFSYNLPF